MGVAPPPAAPAGPPTPVERAKAESDGLRGGIAAGLADARTGSLAESDTHLVKFHGIYQQDDRDLREERARRKLEPAHSFMLRLRVPGGVMGARQWLQCDRIARRLTTRHTLRLTNRQTIQFHGIPKTNLRAVVRSCGQALLDSIAACGDVNRNVVCPPGPPDTAVRRAVRELAVRISEELLPRTRAYHEIWLGEERVDAAPGAGEEDPLYGERYLPRKFKIAIAVPPRNDTDVLSNDIGFVAIVERGTLRGYNVAVGGGMGMTFGDGRTHPRLADVLGFCAPGEAVGIAWHLAAIQRDHGDRSDRRVARFKYTVERLGLDFVRDELARRAGIRLGKPRPFRFDRSGDPLGWQGEGDRQRLTLFIENGRIADRDGHALKTALAEIAGLDCCEFNMTPSQNLMLSSVSRRDRARVEAVLERRGVAAGQEGLSGLRRGSMACVALPTCPLAMAEAERYLPALVSRVEEVLGTHGLRDEEIGIRMSGCPNGCARPHLGEIALVGKSPGRYNLYLGASPAGTRLARLHGENLDEDRILAALTPVVEAYARDREPGERLGDFVVRAGIVLADG